MGARAKKKDGNEKLDHGPDGQRARTSVSLQLRLLFSPCSPGILGPGNGDFALLEGAQLRLAVKNLAPALPGGPEDLARAESLDAVVPKQDGQSHRLSQSGQGLGAMGSRAKGLGRLWSLGPRAGVWQALAELGSWRRSRPPDPTMGVLSCPPHKWALIHC